MRCTLSGYDGGVGIGAILQRVTARIDARRGIRTSGQRLSVACACLATKGLCMRGHSGQVARGRTGRRSAESGDKVQKREEIASFQECIQNEK